MPSVSTVLVVGGGTSGNAITVLLRRAGIEIDLVETEPGWNIRGSGITLQGNALRVLREIGVWDQVLEHGFPFNTLGLTAPDGTVLHIADEFPAGGADLPATLGMQRPALQRILTDAVRASGARVRLGCTVKSLTQDDTGVEVTFDDGATGRYDLVVAADGRRSATRAMIGITDRPESLGMGIWRAPAPRPAGVERSDLTYGGPCYIAGYTPTGDNSIYALLVERQRDRDSLEHLDLAAEMRRLTDGYGGHWAQIRESINDPSQVNYTVTDRMLVEGPWHRGRVVLVGDAAHCCPPTLAQGAAMALEDALVLAELLNTRDTFDEALLTEYHARRVPRVRLVVDGSVQLCRWLLDGVADADVPGLMARTMTALGERP
ncbi:FAD-dependent oxidoreductase [Streptomyces sp. Li-HN-5-11]|uniref:FAD-dependent oxidoreductase n=1 Tax=Streptomyces sp. Li-HN-5-11 TaxID=3075432 RepID=UPI0028A5A6BF|nr:FAD-dependent oxidoreductase [Streptomyces sp. Li-HN-5-11]WNM31663.1 FAD-dependent oxidoreductase [Streptomyces sp. Li-HN-5-11]